MCRRFNNIDNHNEMKIVSAVKIAEAQRLEEMSRSSVSTYGGSIRIVMKYLLRGVIYDPRSGRWRSRRDVMRLASFASAHACRSGKHTPRLASAESSAVLRPPRVTPLETIACPRIEAVLGKYCRGDIVPPSGSAAAGTT